MKPTEQQIRDHKELTQAKPIAVPNILKGYWEYLGRQYPTIPSVLGQAVFIIAFTTLICITWAAIILLSITLWHIPIKNSNLLVKSITLFIFVVIYLRIFDAIMGELRLVLMSRRLRR